MEYKEEEKKEEEEGECRDEEGDREVAGSDAVRG